MKIAKYLFGTVCNIMVMATAVSAGDKEDALIDKLVSAYGADVLASAESMTLEDRYKRLSFQQGLTPHAVGVGTSNNTLIIDFENRRKSTEVWFKGGGNTFNDQSVFNGKTGFSLDNLQKTYGEDTNLNYETMGQGNLRRSDIGLVMLLLDARSEAVHGGDALYDYKPHEKITFKIGQFPDVTLYIDKSTYLVSKMSYQSSFAGEVAYKFSDHKKTDNITYANSTNIFVRGQPILVLVSRTVKINSDVSEAFGLPDGYRDNGGNIDTSEMLTQKLANGVYFASQRGASSLFVDVGDHYIAVGSRPSLTERLKAVQKLAGNEKPLGTMVITHHHSDHIAAADEIAALGASFVAVEDSIQTLRDMITTDVADERFILVDGMLSLAGGKVKLYDFGSLHADHNLLFYVPGANILFNADHFYSSLKTGLPTATEAMVVFQQAIESLDLDVDRLVSSHGSRIHTMDDLRAATRNFKGWPCLTGNPICS
ncbi:MAG: hypothetical protein JKY60_03410 [Kordiimonadaceae bacterium]|nr:hypothetical protein [Kordiimonadaceae bacterium]